jgi:hypothetical protein
MSRRVEVRKGDVLVYQGKEIAQDVLEAVTGTGRRLLWAFVANDNGDIMAVPYTEEECIWMSASDVRKENEVEI